MQLNKSQWTLRDRIMATVGHLAQRIRERREAKREG